MDKQVIANALPDIDRTLAYARSAMRQIEAGIFGYDGFSDPDGSYEYPEVALSGQLESVYETLLVVLDAAGMQDTRAGLIKNWLRLETQEGGVGRVLDDDDSSTCHNSALTYLERVTHGLQISTREELSTVEAAELGRLKWMLSSTAVLAHRRGAVPGGELDVQGIMHDYLSASFLNFTKSPQINGRLGNFKPDCGIIGLRAAVEVKIVHNLEDVIKAVKGVMEDIGGYNIRVTGTGLATIRFSFRRTPLRLKLIFAKSWTARVAQPGRRSW